MTAAKSLLLTDETQTDVEAATSKGKDDAKVADEGKASEKVEAPAAKDKSVKKDKKAD
nr:hypothetical protein [uncultured Cohaesibacter sp.]